MITEFNKTNLCTLRDEINEALAAVAEKHNITLNAASATFYGSTMHFKLEGAVIGEDGVAKSKEREALEAFYPQYVDKEVYLGRGVSGKVVGYSRRAKKYPFLVETPKGVYKIMESDITR